MSFIIETAIGGSAASIVSLIKQWSELKNAKKKKNRD
jgi:hypothetical protein